MNRKKIALITGASSGMGKETAIKLSKNNYIVYAGARRIDRMEELKDYGINIMSLDVTDENSMINCINTIYEKEGNLDILVNNAGYGSYGPVETVLIEEAKRQFEVNIFGLARLIQLVTPKMRENNYGKIINVSSVGGKVYTKYGGWYHATKHALEGLSDCLRIELEKFGIDVIIIEPGGIKTDWGIIAGENLKENAINNAYKEDVEKAANNMIEMYQSNKLIDPKVLAKTIYKSIIVKKPKTRYLKGYMAKTLLMVRNLFGDRIYDKIIQKFS